MTHRPQIIADLSEQARAWEALGFKKMAEQTRLEIEQMLKQRRQSIDAFQPQTRRKTKPTLRPSSRVPR